MLGPPRPAVPVFLVADGVDVDTETPELWLFSEAALELGEARESRETDHVIPQLEGVGVVG